MGTANQVFVKLKSSEPGYILYLAVVVLGLLCAYGVLILTLRRFAVTEARRGINEIQAEALAYSGLSLAQAYAAGYENGGAFWQTQAFTRNVPQGGAITISATRSAGWLKIRSKGSFIADTVILDGTLGQSPPQFSQNVLSLRFSDADVIVADRAVVSGNIATSGGKVQIRNGGVFKGRRVKMASFAFCDSAIEAEIAEEKSTIFKPAKITNLKTIQPKAFDSVMACFNKTAVDSMLVAGSVTFKACSLDFGGVTLFVNGGMKIKGCAKISNLKAFITGDLELDDSSRSEFCTLVSLGNVRIRGNATCQSTIVGADSFVVSQTATVVYPSFLYLSRVMQTIGGSQIVVVQDKAVVKGVIAAADFHDNAEIPRIITCGRSPVEGLIICPGAVTLYGCVSGSVYAGKIVYRLERSVYDNWLRDASIEYRDMSLATMPFLFPTRCRPRYLKISKASGNAL